MKFVFILYLLVSIPLVVFFDLMGLSTFLRQISSDITEDVVIGFFSLVSMFVLNYAYIVLNYFLVRKFW